MLYTETNTLYVNYTLIKIFFTKIGMVLSKLPDQFIVIPPPKGTKASSLDKGWVTKPSPLDPGTQFILLCFADTVFNKLKVHGNPATIKLLTPFFQQYLLTLSLCYILVIHTVFQTFSLLHLLQRSTVRDDDLLRAQIIAFLVIKYFLIMVQTLLF